MLSLSWSYHISDDRVNIETNGDGSQLTSVLTIDSTLLSDAGVYVCNASTQEFIGYIFYNLTIGEFIMNVISKIQQFWEVHVYKNDVSVLCSYRTKQNKKLLALKIPLAFSSPHSKVAGIPEIHSLSPSLICAINSVRF